MNKRTLALIAGAIMGLAAAPAIAAVATTHPTTPGCQINCDPGEPANPGEPFVPPEGCMFNCDEISTIPDPGKPGTSTQFALDGCGEKLGALRDVTASQIRGVDADDVVDIIAVCRAKSLATEQDDVAQLRPEIDQNEVLHSELGGDGYNAHDVVGVVVNGKAVILYVHRI
jgi:hypothetical protein